jgi:hypothetical protein
MREELRGPKVENIGVAVVRDSEFHDEPTYNVYLLNLGEEIIEGVIITSKGYGENRETGEKIRTSTLRHTLEILLPNEAAKIEPIMEDVFGLANEYWVSFWINDKMYDKKYVFVAESISEDNMKTIPVLGAKGVMIV